ncbi:MAG: NAD(P)/FAD-dependent oxidoreductase [Candidatus Hydrogenedentes bacterium]|nr:NAD(P)/FAD-dependent oxidoreductase [Candidatus Hydrogenedentota bacterium]
MNIKEKIYDVAVIGAGCCGASIVRKLSAYDLSVVLLEKCVDIGFGVSKANSGIIHAGFHHPVTSLKARLEIRGNLMFDQLHYELNFPFKRIGIIVAAFSIEEMKTVEHLYAQGIANGVPRLEVCSRERILSLEPQLNPDVVGGLFAPTGGIVEPYRYVFALVESAEKNGVEVKKNFTVWRGVRKEDYWMIESKEGEFVKAKYVVNSAGLYADEVSKAFNAEEFKIIPRKGEEFLLQRNARGLPSHVIFPVPGKHTKGVLVIPTVEGTLMVGPTAEEIEDKEDLSTTYQNLEKVFVQATYMVPKISRREIITSFAGLRPTLPSNDFYIEPSKKQPNFIQVAGIQSPGLTASPAIGEYVKDILKNCGLKLIEKTDYDPYLPKPVKVRELSFEELERLIESDPRYGNIVCRCETVSEAEIIEAIRKGHTTLDGIKFYTRAGMGLCQGAFCSYRILKIIAREVGIPIEKITKRGGDSWIIYKRLQDIDLNQ